MHGHRSAWKPAIFPAFVAVHSVEIDASDLRDPEGQFPTIPLPEALTTAARKRQIDYLAGRACTRAAMRCVAPELAERPVGRGSSGEPLWPAGVVGAITHTAGYASAAVARARDARAIGLDAEHWMPADVANNVLAHLARRDEVDALGDASGLSFAHALTLLFSIKESLYKCLFPQVLRYFDFRDAEVACVDAQRGIATATLLATLTPSLPAGLTFEVRFEHNAQLVCTGIVLTGD